MPSRAPGTADIESGASSGEEISEVGVPVRVANALRLEGPKDLLPREESRAVPPPTDLWMVQKSLSAMAMAPVKGPQDSRRDGALGKSEAYPTEGIRGLKGLQACAEAKHCPSEGAPGDIGS